MEMRDTSVLCGLIYLRQCGLDLIINRIKETQGKRWASGRWVGIRGNCVGFVFLNKEFKRLSFLRTKVGAIWKEFSTKGFNSFWGRCLANRNHKGLQFPI